MIDSYLDLALSKDGTPKWDSLLGVTLGVLKDGKVRNITDIKKEVIAQLHIPTEMQNYEYSSGVNVIENKVRFALSELKRGGLLSSPERGTYQITQDGVKLYDEQRDDISKNSLSGNDSDSSVDFAEPQLSTKINVSDVSEWVENHEEAVLDKFLEKILPGKADQKTRRAKSDMFEHLVAKLMEKMGIQGKNGSVTVTPKSKDGGVDIKITRDSLGMQKVYVQVKDYDPNNKSNKGTISRHQMSDFVTVLNDDHAQGIYVTTSSYSQKAKDLAHRHNIVLIDGDKLLELMTEFGVGIKETQTFTLHEVDDLFLDQLFKEENDQ